MDNQEKSAGSLSCDQIIRSCSLLTSAGSEELEAALAAISMEHLSL